jgi:hypothetical protein
MDSFPEGHLSEVKNSIREAPLWNQCGVDPGHEVRPLPVEASDELFAASEAHTLENERVRHA